MTYAPEEISLSPMHRIKQTQANGIPNGKPSFAIYTYIYIYVHMYVVMPAIARAAHWTVCVVLVTNEAEALRLASGPIADQVHIHNLSEL